MKKRLLTQKLNDLTSLVIKVNGSVEIFLNNSETDDYFDIVLNSENQSFEFGNSLILTNNDERKMSNAHKQIADSKSERSGVQRDGSLFPGQWLQRNLVHRI